MIITERSKIIDFLVQYFNDEDLTTLCLGHFPVVHENFGLGQSKKQKILSLVEWCYQHGEVPGLLALLEQERPKVFLDSFGVNTSLDAQSPIPPVLFSEKVAVSEGKEKDYSASILTEMVLIPAWRFLMGSLRNMPHAHQNELPQHEVTLPHYCLGRYPVTNGEYAHFVQAKGVTPPTHWVRSTPPAEIIDHPVTHVSLLDAQAYTEWLSAETGHTYRLPTEQEWEKAARGGWPDNRVYVWGNQWQENACNTKEAGIGGTTAVTHYAATNISPYRIVDMLGNVWEWTGSDYKPYATNQFSTSTTGKYVVRGGCWDYEQKYAHVSCRGRYNPGERKAYLGFRLAASPVYMLDDVRLQKILKERFNMSELRQLALALGINDQVIPQREIVEMSTEFTKHIKRHNLIAKLAEAAPQQRPDIHWDEAIRPETPT